MDQPTNEGLTDRLKHIATQLSQMRGIPLDAVATIQLAAGRIEELQQKKKELLVSLGKVVGRDRADSTVLSNAVASGAGEHETQPQDDPDIQQNIPEEEEDL